MANLASLLWFRGNLSHRDPLDGVAGDAPAPPVVDLGGPRVGVPGQVLDVLQRYVLAQQVRDHQDPERVGREDLRQPGRP